MKYFTQSHEWLELKDHIGTVGITHYAQAELGEIVFIELPKVGDKIKASQEISVLESTKAAADVYAPVSGEIISINEALSAKPSLINQAAEGAGWLFKLKLSHLKELDHLMDEKQYRALVHQQ